VHGSPAAEAEAHGPAASPRGARLRVVLFSGGRGSGALTAALVRMPGVDLTLAINGYDDGASTGEVRRFLGDALGPSDFRKNASRLAASLGSCAPSLVALLDRRLPDGSGPDRIASMVAELESAPSEPAVAALAEGSRRAVAARLRAFLDELRSSGRGFRFDDCSVGNLVFAGAYLLAARDFNRAVDDYAALVGLPAGLIENVTDGTDAHLVAIGAEGGVLGTEAEIVDANQRNAILEIFLVDRLLGADEVAELTALGPEEATKRLNAISVTPPLNERLAPKVREADVIIYAPGTQHSSLFPSYLTAGLTPAIAANLRAMKVLITNIQADAEIAGSSAVDIIGRAVHYLKEKGRLGMPTPALITHFLMNDPGEGSPTTPYVPLGRLDTLQDPRLVRVGQLEEGVTGRHDARKVLAPFVSAALEHRARRRRVAVVLYDAGATDKLALTLIEMVRGGVADLPVDLTVFCETDTAIDAPVLALLPFAVRHVPPLVGEGDATLRRALADGGFEYVALFESSGMYNGEDVPWLLSHLTGRLDAVWGSRRLSVRDIEESLRVKYRHSTLLRLASYVGSHVLSDTLSGARAMRVEDACRIELPLTHKRANQQLLSVLLGRRAEMFEVPVHFYSASPDQVKRTTVVDGVQSILGIVWARLRPARGAAPKAAPQADRASAPRSS
jgi:2-phospho-L-lactate transferase/gluconeogenesis factor (CofD/UPF0052 family)